MNKKIKRFISKGLIMSTLFINIPINSFAGILSEDTRYETFEGESIKVGNVLEENKAEVEIDGNTLVNYSHIKSHTAGPASYNMNPLLIPGNTYTFSGKISDVVNGPFQGAILRIIFKEGDFITPLDTTYKNGNFKVVFTIPSNKEIKSFYIGWIRNHVGGQAAQLDDLMILDGDWSKKEMPEYFEGIKSVGENKSGNGHKIEILSTGKNLFDNTKVKENPEMPAYMKPAEPIKVKPNTTYTKSNNTWVELHDSIGNITVINQNVSTFTTNADTVRVSFNIEKELVGTFQFVEGDSIYGDATYNKNSKEIFLNEPLRSLPYGTRDRIVKKDGKWYIERNCMYLSSEQLSQHNWYVGNRNDEHETNLFYAGIQNSKPSNGNPKKVICSGLVSKTDLWWVDIEGIHKYYNNTQLQIRINKDKCSDVKLFPKWIVDNDIEVILELASPVYEPLYMKPSINLYKDISYMFVDDAKCQNIKVTVDRVANRAKEYSEIAKVNPSIENISIARMWANLMKDSILKDEIQNSINSIVQIDDLEIEKKTVSANVDLYIESENTLSMSLSTNSIVFEDFTGTDELEMINAVDVIVSSSLPYDLKVSMPSGIYNADKSNSMDINVLKIKASEQTQYKSFANNSDKIVLKENCEDNDNAVHSIDLKLSGGNTYKADVYKTVLKFEAEQR